ncbi:pyridoxamine 5'-phosphate oxidase family protein [Actibacterium sp. 188UL27-1]|uniref:pyridoxamine 5'-phosphate oxidase family protein n=1 Tax=Actibacterium sp. 188UL27-1 TaxID=2786961 RepID=UPI00195A4B26|nr:pyridoxamine 5'-phosphate oxidase family protein [Actibacterium sp. 188UL27-1]MBM7066330.1 pyridoxamine 5'-phosphate oxidase family protein [Actibacterium sp. 188UL27-1]
MKMIETIEALETCYGTPGDTSLRKVAHQMTPLYRAWIQRARFCILTTVGPGGTDGSPRGDDGPVIRELDPKTLALPDWHGNNRIDSLRNIILDPHVSLMFMVPGSANVIRLNGTAQITADDALRETFGHKGKLPRTVTLVTIGEIYFQCARALLRSDLWSGEDHSAGLPTPGDLLAEQTQGTVGGADYDIEWPDRAARTMW